MIKRSGGKQVPNCLHVLTGLPVQIQIIGPDPLVGRLDLGLETPSSLLAIEW